MKITNRSQVIRIVVAVVVIAGVAVVVREVFGCTPPRDEAAMIERFEADPLTDTAPKDGRLVQDWSHTYWCDSGHGYSPTSPGFAEVKRLYQTPAAYSADQLRQLFDAPAAAGGWTFHTQGAGAGGDYVRLMYTKHIGCPISAYIVSSSSAVITGDADDLKRSPGVELLLATGSQCRTEKLRS